MNRMSAKRVQVCEALRDSSLAGSQLTVGQVMTTSPKWVLPTDNLMTVVDMFRSEGFRHPLVADAEGHLRGVVSDRDVLKILGTHPSKESLNALPVSEVMSMDILSITSSMPLHEAVSMILDQGISCLPVVDNNKLVGILTVTDLCVTLQMILPIVYQTEQKSQPKEASHAKSSVRR